MCINHILILIPHCTPPARCLFLLLRPPHSCFVFVYFQTCGSYKKKTLRMKQKPVLWLTAGNRGLEKKHMNSQMRQLNRMIIVHSQLEDNGAMIWNDV